MSDRKVQLYGSLFVDNEAGMTSISDERKGVTVVLPATALNELLRWLSQHFPANYASFSRPPPKGPTP